MKAVAFLSYRSKKENNIKEHSMREPRYGTLPGRAAQLLRSFLKGFVFCRHEFPLAFHDNGGYHSAIGVSAQIGIADWLLTFAR